MQRRGTHGARRRNPPQTGVTAPRWRVGRALDSRARSGISSTLAHRRSHLRRPPRVLAPRVFAEPIDGRTSPGGARSDPQRGVGATRSWCSHGQRPRADGLRPRAVSGVGRDRAAELGRTRMERDRLGAARGRAGTSLLSPRRGVRRHAPTSGFCVAGVCCDRACNRGCEACSIATGSTSDGVCEALPDSGTACEDPPDGGGGGGPGGGGPGSERGGCCSTAGSSNRTDAPTAVLLAVAIGFLVRRRMRR